MKCYTCEKYLFYYFSQMKQIIELFILSVYTFINTLIKVPDFKSRELLTKIFTHSQVSINTSRTKFNEILNHFLNQRKIYILKID
jgi:hypothetical protein